MRSSGVPISARKRVRAEGLSGRLEDIGVAAIADCRNISGSAKVQPPGGLGILFGLGEQCVGGATGKPLRHDMRLAFGCGHVLMKVKAMRRIDNPRNTSAGGRQPSHKGGGGCVHMYEIKFLAREQFLQGVSGTQIANGV